MASHNPGFDAGQDFPEARPISQNNFPHLSDIITRARASGISNPTHNPDAAFDMVLSCFTLPLRQRLESMRGELLFDIMDYNTIDKACWRIYDAIKPANMQRIRSTRKRRRAMVEDREAADQKRSGNSDASDADNEHPETKTRRVMKKDGSNKSDERLHGHVFKDSQSEENPGLYGPLLAVLESRPKITVHNDNGTDKNNGNVPGVERFTDDVAGNKATSGCSWQIDPDILKFHDWAVNTIDTYKWKFERVTNIQRQSLVEGASSTCLAVLLVQPKIRQFLFHIATIFLANIANDKAACLFTDIIGVKLNFDCPRQMHAYHYYSLPIVPFLILSSGFLRSDYYDDVQSYLMKRIPFSHLCPNPECVNILHMTQEDMDMDEERKACHKEPFDCCHHPRCHRASRSKRYALLMGQEKPVVPLDLSCLERNNLGVFSEELWGWQSNVYLMSGRTGRSPQGPGFPLRT